MEICYADLYTRVYTLPVIPCTAAVTCIFKLQSNLYVSSLGVWQRPVCSLTLQHLSSIHRKSETQACFLGVGLLTANPVWVLRVDESIRENFPRESPSAGPAGPGDVVQSSRKLL